MSQVLGPSGQPMMPRQSGWIGFDLDGTLAHYERGQHNKIGAPIEPMVELAKDYMAKGFEVRIVTARLGLQDQEEVLQQIELIHDWCVRVFGRPLLCTALKDFQMILLYDDRAVAVEHNTGRILGGGDGNHA